MTALSKLLNAANVADWPTREIADRAKAAGFSLGHDTVAKYLRGAHPQRPGEKTLQAFVAVWPALTLEALREAADLPREVTGADLPPEVSRLTPRQWDAVKEVILSMVNPGNEQGATVTELHPEAPDSNARATKVARRTGRGPDLAE